MHEVLVNHLGGLSLPRKSVVRLTDRPDMTLDVFRGRKTQQQLVLIQAGPSVGHLDQQTILAYFCQDMVVMGTSLKDICRSYGIHATHALIC